MLICFQAEKSTLLQSEKQRKSEKYIYKSFLLIINLSLKVENLFFLKVWKHDNTFKLFNCYLYFLFYMFTYLFYCNLYKEPTNYNNVRIINLLNCLCNAQRMKPGLSSDRKHLLFFYWYLSVKFCSLHPMMFQILFYILDEYWYMFIPLNHYVYLILMQYMVIS